MESRKKGLAASKWMIVLLKVQCLLGREEKEDANQCEVTEIVNASGHEEVTTSVGQNDQASVNWPIVSLGISFFKNTSLIHPH